MLYIYVVPLFIIVRAVHEFRLPTLLNIGKIGSKGVRRRSLSRLVSSAVPSSRAVTSIVNDDVVALIVSHLRLSLCVYFFDVFVIFCT